MALRTSLAPQPHLYMGDIQGRPLDAGKVYFGEPNKDPELYPINVYYDEALTIAAPQPVRTMGGFMNANGQMVEIYAAEIIYSVKVLDGYGRQVFYQQSMSSTSTSSSVSTILPYFGAVERTQSEKNADTVSIRDFYNPVIDLDWTNAFQLAAASGLTVVVPNIPDITYNITGSIELINASKLIGTGNPEVNLYLTDSKHRGFWGKESGFILAGITINKYLTAASADGRWLNAICINDFGDAQNLVKNWIIKDITINDLGAVKHNTVSIYGNTAFGIIDNVTVNGAVTYSLLMHWGYNDPFTKSYHPRDIAVRDWTLNGDIDNSYGAYLSAPHNISLERITLNNVSRGIIIAGGEYGGLYADTPSKDKVLSGLSIDGLRVKGCKNAFLLASARGGESLKVGQTNRWHGLDDNVNLNVRDVTVLRDANSTFALLDINHFKNVNIESLNISNLPDAEKVSTAPRIKISEGVNINISCNITAAKAVELTSGKDITINGNITCSASSPNSATTAVDLTGSVSTVTSGALVAAGGTSIVITNVTKSIYRGMKFMVGANAYVFDSSWTFDPTTAANNLNRTLKIKPAIAAIPASSSLSLLTGVDGFTLKGSVYGFFTSYTQTSASTLIPTRVVIDDVEFDKANRYHIELSGGGTFDVRNSSFKDANKDAANSRSNIRIDSIDTFKAQNCVFDKERSDVSFAIHIASTAAANYTVEGCYFYNLRSSGTRGCIYSNHPIINASNNYFSPAVRSVAVAPTNVIPLTAVGSNIQGQGLAVPTVSTWAVGDKVYNANPSSGAPIGWICTVAGTPGTWVSMGNL